MPLAVRASVEMSYAKAVRPTIYFIGVSTGKSSIMRVFPRWAETLGLRDVEIRGVDCRLHDDPQVYRSIVRHIQNDPLSKGALVTTHKLDLLHACRDQFDRLDPYAELMGEVSSISKRDSRLMGHAKDPISSGLSVDSFLPFGHWSKTGSEALVLGAGGSSLALTSYWMQEDRGEQRPSKIVVSDRSAPRLEEMRAIHQKIGSPIATEYRLISTPEENDSLLAGLSPGSLVVNATGLGKDAPGSPLTDAAHFPECGFAWDFNYRGDLVFLDQAQAQSDGKSLTVEDGWVYFLHGWTRVIAEVFDIDIPTSGPTFEALSQIAAAARGQPTTQQESSR